MIRVTAILVASFCSTTTFAAEVPRAAASVGALIQPSTLMLVGLGLVGLAFFRTRSRDEK